MSASHGLDADTVELAPVGPSRKVAGLLRDAAEAAQVRAAREDPNVVALGIERTRGRVDRAIWLSMIVGLSFTMTTVQVFAANGVGPSSPTWWAAWVFDPMLTIGLLALLMAEQVMARWLVPVGGWIRFARWWVLACTYAMNTWNAWASRDAGQIVLHSIPPLTVAILAEAITQARTGLTAAVRAAIAYLTPPTDEPEPAEDDDDDGDETTALVVVPPLEELEVMVKDPLRRLAARAGIETRDPRTKNHRAVPVLRDELIQKFYPDARQERVP